MIPVPSIEQVLTDNHDIEHHTISKWFVVFAIDTWHVTSREVVIASNMQVNIASFYAHLTMLINPRNHQPKTVKCRAVLYFHLPSIYVLWSRTSDSAVNCNWCLLVSKWNLHKLSMQVCMTVIWLGFKQTVLLVVDVLYLITILIMLYLLTLCEPRENGMQLGPKSSDVVHK